MSIESGSNDNQVIGNYIGTDASGHFADGFGDTSIGVGITDSYNNDVDDNTIRGNQFGVGIKNATSINNRIQGNVITNSVGYGVLIASGASDNVVGGPSDGDGNQISQNGDAGVWADSGTGNAILRNAIFGNAGLGIDLAPAGVTANDPQASLDADTGPNNLQNFPVLITATTGASQQVSGTLSSAANSTFLIQLFNLDAADSSGNGQGDRYLTTTAVTTNASGMASFNVTLPNNVLAGTFISATATDSDGNTSEFSQAILVETDTDGDGIGDETENGVPNDDGNDDGIPDSQQANVASFQDAVSGQYITLVAPVGTTFSDVSAVTNPSADNGPTDLSFDYGLFSFTLSGVTPGGSVAVQEILPSGASPEAYYRYGSVPWDSNPEWYLWSYNGFPGSTGAEINGNVVTLHFIDGQFGDDDLSANGTIVDPGGPVFPVKYTVTNTNDSGPGSLRQAILDSNSNFGGGIINFKIDGGGVQTIMPLSTLPTITEPVTIDGTTQPGFAGTPIIELDGEQAAGGSGIVIFAPNVTVRGLVINRFENAGIFDTGYLSGSIPSNYPHIYNDAIVGNYIGTDVTGLLAEPNGTGLLLGGIGGGYFQIGGTTAADRNVISGNIYDGISIEMGFTYSIEGNYIGVGADGTTPLGNGGTGVDVSQYSYLTGYHAQDIHVGGPDADQGNIIAYNDYGVENDEAFLLGPIISSSTSILSNSIYANKVLGISLDENNDFFNSVLASGSDRQPQNYPVLNSAVSSGGETTITGYLNSAADQSFTIQFFSNAGVPFTNFAQGAQYLGSTTVTTDDNGHASFTATFNVSLAPHTLITTTATNQENETSPFSDRLAVGDVLGNVYVVNTTDDTDVGYADPAHLTLREAIIAANNHPGLDTIEFDIPGSGVQTIAPVVPLPAIFDAVDIDGSSQPGYAGTPLIQLSGANMDPSAENFGFNPRLRLTGLSIQANNSTIRGLDINSFFRYIVAGTSIIDQGGQPINISGDNNVLAGDFIGTDPTGTVAKPNLNSVNINGNNNRIGGTTAADRNLISGNWYGELSVGR